MINLEKGIKGFKDDYEKAGNEREETQLMQKF